MLTLGPVIGFPDLHSGGKFSLNMPDNGFGVDRFNPLTNLPESDHAM